MQRKNMPEMRTESRTASPNCIGGTVGNTKEGESFSGKHPLLAIYKFLAEA